MLIASSKRILIVGGGVTGLSIARYLHAAGKAFWVFDTREDQTLLKPFKAIDAGVACFSKTLDAELFDQIGQVIVSPGVSRTEAVITDALAHGIEVVGDVALFLRAAKAPVIGITGSNGKSTVTTMVALAAQQAGIRVAVGGNLGEPALDLLSDDVAMYVLELSSFQLESTPQANLQVAAILNVSDDHLDRHGSMMAYFSIKQRIFHGAKKVVYKLDDTLTRPPEVEGVARSGFALNKKKEVSETQFWFDAQQEILFCGDTELMRKSDIKQRGLHNIENVLAVFAIADAAGIARYAVSHVAATFQGLAHRCEVVSAGHKGCYINDSKATNEGACIAALNGLADEFSKVVLIAGGQAKGSQFNLLAKAIKAHVDLLVLMGEDAALIDKKIGGEVNTVYAGSMQEAVNLAGEGADANTLILLSPACASFDMFNGFAHRGDEFRHAVEVCLS